MKHLSLIFTLLLLAAATAPLSSCSCSGKIRDKEVTERVRDKSAYSLGEIHAAEVINVASEETEVQDRLLEVRARITNISVQISPQSAADYERGFTDYIKAHSDSLAALLF